MREAFPDMIFDGELYRDDVNKISYVLGSYRDFLDTRGRFPDLESGTWGGRGATALFGDLGVKGITKAHAIDRLLAHLGANRQDTVAFGDAAVDIPMLEYCAVGVAMGNGSEDIKAMAGIVAGTIFLLFQWGYVYVQRWMTSYNAIYGSFAALPLLLIWMQTSWEILLFGGELSFAYQNIARFGEERESLLISYDQRRKVLLAVMLTVVRNFRDRGGALPADEIRERLDLPTRIVNDVLFQLVQAGQLIAVRSGDGERETAFTPAHDIASMTVYGVLEAVERSGQTTFDLGQTPELARIDRELETLKESARRSQDNVRLTDLL